MPTSIDLQYMRANAEREAHREALTHNFAERARVRQIEFENDQNRRLYESDLAFNRAVYPYSIYRRHIAEIEGMDALKRLDYLSEYIAYTIDFKADRINAEYKYPSVGYDCWLWFKLFSAFSLETVAIIHTPGSLTTPKQTWSMYYTDDNGKPLGI